MAALSSWYHHQYSTWNRTRRLSQPQYLARVDTRASRAATEMAQQPVVIDMGSTAPSAAQTKEKKSADTLFGPNIGVLSTGPKWTERAEKTPDPLTAEVVKSWIAKSKETHYSTTTLQALVNLKRPTLRLSPLEVETTDDSDHIDSQHHHGLEFEYDCDAPKCAIEVKVTLSPNHPMAGKPGLSGYSEVLVYASTVDGGFGKLLKLSDGATLELGRFDSSRVAQDAVAEPSASADAEKRAETPSDEPAAQRKKRMSVFHFRKRSQTRAVTGPALPVVDADANNNAAATEEKAKDASKDEDEEVGVRVTIRLTALDEEGKPLPSANEQVTYLHIVRFGAPPVPIEGAEAEEDKRPWVVKVVKREATIGPHTFHLHEIYGLSANSTTSSQPETAPVPTTLDTHVYPPVASTTANAEDEPSSECLLCLSSPREVVLLPCRHLVACRECALNMIEFGAGGTITQPEAEPAPAAAEPAASGENVAEGGEAATGSDPNAPPATPATAAPAANPRRKRKAKGWFCPVCRQPYTSLLRITTNPPEKDEGRESASIDEPAPAPVPAVPEPAAAAPERAQGRFASLRPSFLRGTSRAGNTDLERGLPQAQAPSVAAA